MEGKALIQSKAFWGAVVMLLDVAAKATGWDLGDQQAWVDAIAGLGGFALILWGRIGAVKPITSILPKSPSGPAAGCLWLGIPLLAGLLAASFFLTGCMGAFGTAGMKAADLKELAKIKDAGLTCARGVYAGASVNLLAIDVDKGVPANMTIDDNCKATFSTIPPQKP